MSVTLSRATTTKGVTYTCSACGCPSKTYTESCTTCTTRRRQHRRRQRQREERAQHRSGRLYVVSSGGTIGRIVWRPEDECSSSRVYSMVQGIASRSGDPDVDVMREIPCTMVEGIAVYAAVQEVSGDDEDYPWHDLDSVSHMLDELSPAPERVEFDDPVDLLGVMARPCTYGEREYLLLSPIGGSGLWFLRCRSTGDELASTRSLVSSDRSALVWAKLTIRNGWPKS